MEAGVPSGGERAVEVLVDVQTTRAAKVKEEEDGGRVGRKRGGQEEMERGEVVAESWRSGG